MQKRLKFFFLMCFSILLFSCAGGVQEKEETIEAGGLKEMEEPAAEDKSAGEELRGKSAEAATPEVTYVSEAEAPLAPISHKG